MFNNDVSTIYENIYHQYGSLLMVSGIEAYGNVFVIVHIFLASSVCHSRR